MTTEDEIRRTLHPEAYDRLGSSGFQTACRHMEFNPRPRPRMPLGCDQQGRYPEAADPRIDDDEPQPPQRDPWWHDWVLLAVGVLLFAAIFAPLGVK